jgi:hypothetical protein
LNLLMEVVHSTCVPSIAALYTSVISGEILQKGALAQHQDCLSLLLSKVRGPQTHPRICCCLLLAGLVESLLFSMII